MTIKDYIKEYTAGRRICFSDVLREIKELFVEIFKFNKKGVSEEFQDVLHFLQLWLHWRFGINGEFWSATQKSVAKFMNRKKVWQEIYEFVGLNKPSKTTSTGFSFRKSKAAKQVEVALLGKDISGYVGNYNKVEKVINHLSQFGVSKGKAKEAYEKIIGVRNSDNTPIINHRMVENKFK